MYFIQDVYGRPRQTPPEALKRGRLAYGILNGLLLSFLAWSLVSLIWMAFR